jgi:hypothetical protein
MKRISFQIRLTEGTNDERGRAERQTDRQASLAPRNIGLQDLTPILDP